VCNSCGELQLLQSPVARRNKGVWSSLGLGILVMILVVLGETLGDILGGSW
jgi:hypothetical protein